jgi:acyl carrier protein
MANKSLSVAADHLGDKRFLRIAIAVPWLDMARPNSNDHGMDDERAIELIRQALKRAVDKEIDVQYQTNLFEEGILDSLDSLVFFLTLEELSGRKLPDGDLPRAGFGAVSQLVEFLKSS